MIIHKTEIQPKFDPIIFTVTIETEEEAKSFYAIFNHSRNRCLFNDEDALDLVKKAIGEKFYVGSGIIANNVDYCDFYVKR